MRKLARARAARAVIFSFIAYLTIRIPHNVSCAVSFFKWIIFILDDHTPPVNATCVIIYASHKTAVTTKKIMPGNIRVKDSFRTIPMTVETAKRAGSTGIIEQMITTPLKGTATFQKKIRIFPANTDQDKGNSPQDP